MSNSQDPNPPTSSPTDDQSNSTPANSTPATSSSNDSSSPPYSSRSTPIRLEKEEHLRMLREMQYVSLHHDGLRAEALRAGADEYVVRPVEPGELRSTCNRLVHDAAGRESRRVLVIDDQKDIRTIFNTSYNMGIPYFVKKCFFHKCKLSLFDLY